MRQKWALTAMLGGLTFACYAQLTRATKENTPREAATTVDPIATYDELVIEHWEEIRNGLLFLADHPEAFADLMGLLNGNADFRGGFHELAPDLVSSYIWHGGPAPQSELPSLLGAYVRKDHGDAGEFGMPVPVDGTEIIDPRCHDDEFKIALVFSDFVTIFDREEDWSESYGGEGTMILSYSRNEVLCTITSESSLITVQFRGGVFGELIDLRIRTLLCDVNGDGMINLTDWAAARSHCAEPITDENCRYDVNLDGAINLTDAAMVTATMRSN